MTANIKRLKLSVFAELYWQDKESRPCRDTLVSHIKRGWLSGALLHKDLKCKAPLIEPNLRRNLGKWST
ncbi:hypothetical protein MF4642_16735 [Acinetobacter sp. MF4642]|uniref:hypothetical protein n=1 Tax=Acinetobacter sp. MF4642 TaxID=1960825 RepID=UPI000994F3C6|nr:hypothetical protein [Acinetobacter sp. MF4642]OOW07579.1 hypothetical protein MF4642_16735 [Acinetobacter sp. MF4642]